MFTLWGGQEATYTGLFSVGREFLHLIWNVGLSYYALKLSIVLLTVVQPLATLIVWISDLILDFSTIFPSVYSLDVFFANMTLDSLVQSIL